MKIALEIKNQGPVPSFKNAKRIFGSKLVTRKDVKKWMAQCTQSFESQLFCATVIGEGATLTAQLQRSSIASSLPHDDSWDWIPQLEVRAVLCNKGEEGATVTIEKL